MTDPVAPTPAPAAAGPAQTLSLVSFILGLVGFVLSFVFGLGFLPGLAAIIVGAMSRKREPQAPSWMRLIGIIGGIVAIVIGFIVFLVTLFVTLLPLLATGAAVSGSGY